LFLGCGYFCFVCFCVVGWLFGWFDLVV